MSLFEEAAKAWAESDKKKWALPIEQDVARAYIDGRNAGRASESARLREKAEAMRAQAIDRRKNEVLNQIQWDHEGGRIDLADEILAFLAEPGKESPR